MPSDRSNPRAPLAKETKFVWQRYLLFQPQSCTHQPLPFRRKCHFRDRRQELFSRGEVNASQAFCLQRHLPTGLQRDKEKQTPLADVLRLIHPELLLPNHPVPLPERRETANLSANATEPPEPSSTTGLFGGAAEWALSFCPLSQCS